MATIKPIFGHNTANRHRLLLLIVLSLLLIFVDHRSNWLDPVRLVLSVITSPIQQLANLPPSLIQGTQRALQDRDALASENSRLQIEVLVLKRRVQRLASTVAENARLRELMQASDAIEDQVLVAEIIGVDSDPYRHEVILNKGRLSRIYRGQAVLDSDGLMGQVIEVGVNSSRVLLVSDIAHGVPVHVNRNGVRAIAVGSGTLDELNLIHVPYTADVVEGDLLVSSGLGQRFPKGYPVATVTQVERDPGRPFAQVKAAPTANLDRSRHVLLVFSPDSVEEAP